ncbi:MAG: sulfite exporter TauE/SafE family protein [Methylococcaceae bacterium]|jgi:hypothetical protein|nr:sulfite exporter TauE/SafE family protein [Methylococcaceae bacterium]MDZ4155329.1 sulfite exporter TauE/SafE family protein [Methylococcales bacterium]MDP2393941.1 sulfite exporter TauE/SafE family protein [Methylococcaceae bacterium]MDP3018071.1 sulfite exporter TauE/SafE family protein [Methylococcaceae bacterium]MDP3391818.1 sulfite exporter TauE/SafE family protein [Methylococcaceae bacterium]
MPVDILIVILATAVVQSIFGVGVLLFGTPLMLLLGYGFVDALSVLLPVSLAISCLQLLKHHQHIDHALYKNVLIYSVPLIMAFLFLVTSVKINIGLIIGFLLVFVAVKSFSVTIENALQWVVRYERVYLAITGLVHGMSNLGGSLLTVLIYSKKYPKDQTRATAAACYATFAFCQLLTLYFIGSEFQIPYSERISLVQVGIVMYLFTEKVLYNRIDNEKYAKLFTVFLFVAGVTLILKSL